MFYQSSPLGKFRHPTRRSGNGPEQPRSLSAVRISLVKVTLKVEVLFDMTHADILKGRGISSSRTDLRHFQEDRHYLNMVCSQAYFHHASFSVQELCMDALKLSSSSPRDAMRERGHF